MYFIFVVYNKSYLIKYHLSKIQINEETYFF